ncbi:MAG: WhiB family transcriptional regulator [Pseudonocardia sp.]|nr:WhiB family transcriptional regulator [Pseudonocardia sp.]
MTGTWRDFALCRQIADTATFYPGKGESSREAKRVCSLCHVRALCLAEAMATPEVLDHGIWGGTSAYERRLMRRGGDRRPTTAPQQQPGKAA